MCYIETMAFDHSQMRASDADRDRLRDVLTSAFNEGRLTYTEFSDRVDELFSARTYADLQGLVKDLPQESQLPAAAHPAQLNTGKTHLSLQPFGWLLFSYFLFLLVSLVIATRGGPNPLFFVVAVVVFVNVISLVRRRRRQRM